MRKREVSRIFALLIVMLTLAPAAQATQLHVGEIGKPILYFPDPQPPSQPTANPLPLTGLTVVMTFQPPGGAAATRTMTVEGNGISCPDSKAPQNSSGACATYSLTAGDLTVPGSYVFQWCVCSSTPCSCSNTNPSLVVKSDQIQIPVGPSF